MRNGYAAYGIPPGYYDRNGDPMPLMAWAKAAESLYRFVACTALGPEEADGYVSTIWVGIPAAVFMPPPGLIFRTAVFATGSKMDQEEWAHSCLEAAIEAHDAIVSAVRLERAAS